LEDYDNIIDVFDVLAVSETRKYFMFVHVVTVTVTCVRLQEPQYIQKWKLILQLCSSYAF